VLRIEHLEDGADPATGARRVQVDRHLPAPEPPAGPHLNGSARPIHEQRQVTEPAADETARPAIDAPDRILELDSRTIDLHPSLGQYLAALSDHIGYEVGTRPESDPDSSAEPADQLERDDDHDRGFGVTDRS
jgi:hypothetical protein